MKPGRLPLFVSPYTLDARAPLNRLTSRRAYPGLLVKQGLGHACLHPWPELGDAPLSEQLAALHGEAETPLGRGLQRCLRLDADARAAGRSLFDGATVPESHATLVSPSITAIEEAAQAGFRCVKIKAGPETLPSLLRLLEETPLPLRIDLNESGSLSLLTVFWEDLSERARENVEFLEDPFPFDPETWAAWYDRTGCPLALDRQNARMREGAFQVLVLKPARDDIPEAERGLRQSGLSFLVTSYMDHPLGLAFAACEAARLSALFPKQILPGGLLTHHLFDPTPFSRQLGGGPGWTAPPGTGLGFDDLLSAQSWTPLYEWKSSST